MVFIIVIIPHIIITAAIMLFYNNKMVKLLPVIQIKYVKVQQTNVTVNCIILEKCYLLDLLS